MDVRGKLVELICRSCSGLAVSDITLPYGYENLSDFMISNGVTVQEWIPVDDRLPEIPERYAESPEPVLYMMKNTKTIYAGYYGEGGVWKDKYFRQYADGSNGVDADDVLCWMYQHDLPQPPKGE